MAKAIRTISLDPACDEWLRENCPNASEFFNSLIMDLIEADMKDDKDFVLEARKRVLRTQYNVLQKEIFELERVRDEVDEILEKSETNPQVLWHMRLDTMRRSRGTGQK